MPYPVEEPDLIDVLLAPMYLFLGLALLAVGGLVGLYDRANAAYKRHLKRKGWRL